MTDSGQTLLEKLEGHIAANLPNEQFGVEQLAEMMGMSRSHLHRKLHKVKGKSISRFIREYRLEAARNMLIEKEMTASEVSHAVGFGSPSYFNKCFTEYFGYSPGKARLRVGQEDNGKVESSKNKKLLWLGGLATAILVGFFIFSQSKKEVVVAEAPSEEKSIIVLPFKNLSSNEENQYLADGMVEAINRHLSSIEELDVLASSASGNLSSIKEIGSVLEVSSVLQGSVQIQDSTFRIEVKLINTANEKQLWANSYDRKVLDVLQIQNEIAGDVAKALDLNFLSEEKSILDKRTAYDPKAYDYFLKGLHYSRTYTPAGQNLAYENLTKALRLDSTIAPAHLVLASYYHIKASVYFAELGCLEAISKGKYHIDKSLELDPDLVEAKAWRAYQKEYYDWDFDVVEQGYKLGIEMNLVEAYNVHISFLNRQHRHEEALAVCKELENKFPFYSNNRFVITHYYLNNWAEAREYAITKLKSDPNSHIILEEAGFFFLNTGEYQKAVELFNKLLDNENRFLPRPIGWLGASYAKMGDWQKAIEQLNRLKKHHVKTDAGSPAWFIAIIHSAMGDKNEALKWLKIAIDDHEMEVPWLVSEPQLYPLHGMPEFDALVKKVGFREHAYPVELPAHFQ